MQHRFNGGKVFEPLQCANSGKDDEERTSRVSRQGIGRAYPDGLKLLGLVGHRGLAIWHAGDQKRHVKTARQVAVGDPVRQHKHVRTAQCEAARGTLSDEGLLAVDGGDVVLRGAGAIAALRDEHAQLFKALANRGNRLRQVQVALRRAAAGLRVRAGIQRVHATPGEHVGARGEARRHGAARHQHLNARIAVAQQ